MKSYIVEIKDYRKEITRYLDVIADSKKSARRTIEKLYRVRHNLGETVGKALERGVDAIWSFDEEYNVTNVIIL